MSEPEYRPAYGSPPHVAPHDFARRGWRFWICRHCYAPRKVHPKKFWSRSRPIHDNRRWPWTADSEAFGQ